ncbi:MAG: diadenylate cyclase CdaA [Planctomycetes bacterium]|nr:diadenylate cyclase CdaA [Planctomycetota bacterium]
MNGVRLAVEIGLLFLGIYAVLRFLQGTRGAGILKGLALLLGMGSVVLLVLTKTLELERIGYLLKEFFTIAVFALILIFQPELRRALMHLGQSPLMGRFLRKEVVPIEEIVTACARLSKDKIGALIAFEREISMASIIEGGKIVDAEVSAELIETIFFPGSSLHDGAVVIQRGRLVAAACLFPLTDNPEVSKRLGTRHRAAIGLTEETDAVTVVVSEETGRISVGLRGHLESDLDRDALRRTLTELLMQEVKRLDGKPA